MGVVTISGGARGIGLATARALIDQGHQVAIGDVDADAVSAAAHALGAGVLSSHLDVTDRASYAEFVALAERELGPVDTLINNAGIMPIGPMVDEAEATVRRVLEVNVLGVFNGMAVGLPKMLTRGSGHIINMASIAGRAPVPGGASYAASKAAIFSATESARVEHRGRGVAFTCVMPSFTATDLILGTSGTKFLKTVSPEDVAKQIAKAVRRPRADVFVPAALGPLVKLQGMMTRGMRDLSQRSIGAYDTFLDVDEGARASYDERIGKAKTPA